MKSIKVRGIKKLGKKLQASVRGGTCTYPGDDTMKCIEYHIHIIELPKLESDADGNTATTLTRTVIKIPSDG